MAFADKWESCCIVRCQQTGLRGFLPWGHAGVCNTMVMDWFRRIYVGKPTWLSGKRKSNGGVPTALSVVDWAKKRDRWMKLQKTGQFSEDDKFGHTARPPMLESGGLDGTDQLYSNSVNGDSANFDVIAALNKIAEHRKASQEDNCFYLLSIHGSKGGHSIGLHMFEAHSRAAKERQREEMESSTGSVENVYDRRLFVAPDKLHLFDPNVGEYVADNPLNRSAGIEEAKRMVMDLMRDLYPGDIVATLSAIHIPVWWGRGEKGKPFFYPEPFDDEQV